LIFVAFRGSDIIAVFAERIPHFIECNPSMNDPANWMKLWLFPGNLPTLCADAGMVSMAVSVRYCSRSGCCQRFYALFQYFHRYLNASLSSLLTCILIFPILFVPMVYFVGSPSQKAYGALTIRGKTRLSVTSWKRFCQ
jgi:hypothetical protein